MVPSNEAVTPVPAIGAPFVNKGGQLLAQVPLQVLVLVVSFLKI